MAGHSHWAGIKHRKAAVDAKKGKIFSKHGKALMVAVRAGGGDPEQNLTLKYAMERARADNMPKDVIERAIKKGTGELGTANFAELIYEGFGPARVAVVVDLLTDNRNRTASELRMIFEKNGGSLGNPGSVLWMFETRGVLQVPANSIDEAALMEAALDAGADDVRHEDDEFLVITAPAAFVGVRRAFEERKIAVSAADIRRHASNTVSITDAQTAKEILEFLTVLEDHEDVQKVSANFDIPDELMGALAG